MSDTAYLIGTLQRRTQSDTWVLTEVRVASEPPWGMTLISSGRFYSLLAAPVTAKSFDAAARAVMRNAEESLFMRQFAHLFAWKKK